MRTSSKANDYFIPIGNTSVQSENYNLDNSTENTSTRDLKNEGYQISMTFPESTSYNKYVEYIVGKPIEKVCPNSQHQEDQLFVINELYDHFYISDNTSRIN